VQDQEREIVMNTSQAITIAIRRLKAPRALIQEEARLEAIETLQRILDQKGCKHFDETLDGSLPRLIDTIVFG
jgi:hypothetical protein